MIIKDSYFDFSSIIVNTITIIITITITININISIELFFLVYFNTLILQKRKERL